MGNDTGLNTGALEGVDGMRLPDGALAKAGWPNPYRKQQGAQFLWGKISGRYPAEGTVDVTLDHGTILPHVPVLPQMLGQVMGETYLPATDPVQPLSTPQGEYGLPTPHPDPTKSTVYAVVGWLEGSGRQPVVIGILPSATSAIAPQDPGWKVFRHESGYWEAVDPLGNSTLTWPDGTTISISTNGTPAAPTDINPQFPSATGSAVTYRLKLSGGAELLIQGDTITLNGGTRGVARLGDTVTVSGTDSAGDTFTATGTITSASTTVLSG